MSRRGALLVLGAAALAGCARGPAETTDNDEADMDLTQLDEAVIAASERVTGVESSERETNGLGHALFMSLLLDTPVPPTAEELDVIVGAIWANVPWEPNAIRLVAGSGAEGAATPVDLEPAAAGLEPLGYRPFGNLGVSLLNAAKKYGDWTKPA